MVFTAFSFYFYCLTGFVLEIIHCMKKVLVGLIMAAMLITAPSCMDYKKPVEGILRIHIRASSDSACDQEIKLAVRDCVVEYLSPVLRGIENATEAENVIYKHKNEMENMIDEMLYSCGFFYGSEILIDTEYFETKNYGEFTLTDGYYRAVIINLGTGKGRNWWCVAFPPLCFTLGEDYENIIYKSILMELLNEEKGDNNEK